MLIISDLAVAIKDLEILKGINLKIAPGSVHALMGPNGSGKSTLAYALMGHPLYNRVRGAIQLKGQEIHDLTPDKRTQRGLFLVFQQPYALAGVTVFAFLKAAHAAVTGAVLPVAAFQILVHEALEIVGLDASYSDRAVNEGFSGGERKRLEMAQMLVLKPTMIILDEIDSGLDVDGLKVVANGIAQLRQENPAVSVLCITHYQRILEYLIPDHVHVMRDGKIVRSGDRTLAALVEASGYAGFVHDE